MLDRRTLSTLFLAALLVGGCSQNPAPPVPVEGADVSSLAGHWVGEYSSTETGRSGSIVFELRSGNKVAHGDVLMKPKEGAPTADDPMRGAPQVLNINFVNATGGTLRGTMDPYTDPSCHCQVVTTFTGRRSGDTIEGTFTTTPQGGEGTASSGRWRITKQK